MFENKSEEEKKEEEIDFIPTSPQFSFLDQLPIHISFQNKLLTMAIPPLFFMSYYR